MKSAFCLQSAFLGLGLVAGCGVKDPSPAVSGHPLPEPPRIAPCEPGRPSGRLRLTASAPPVTFNPVFALDNASDQISRLLSGALVQFDFAEQQATPGLAESWSVSSDGKTWTFRLRRGLHWSDGRPLTSADVAFTWNDVMYNPRTRAPLAPVFRVSGRGFAVSTPDAHTVVVMTSGVFAPFLEFFGSIAILPEHVLGSAARRGDFLSAYEVATRPAQIVGAGPFRLKRCMPGQVTVLERNPEYWATDRAGQRLPYFDEVEIVVVANASTAVEDLLAGRSDVCERLRGDDVPHVQAALSAGRIRLVELGPSPQRDFLWFNQNTNVNRISGQPFVTPHKLAWFRNASFRQAISCALDRERIVREVYGGRAVPCETYLGAESGRWHNPDVPRFGFDRARTRTLLAEAGLQDRDGDGLAEDAEGRPCEIVLLTNTGNPIREKIASFIVEDLRQIGVKMVLEQVSFDALEQKINDDLTYESVLMGLSGGGGDPASHLNVLLSREPLHQWFPQQAQPSTDWEARVDALMDAQMCTLDFGARKKAFDEVQAILAEQLPMIFTVTPLLYGAARADLGNGRPSVLAASALTWNLEELFLQTK